MAECRMSGCIYDSSRRMASFKSNRLDGQDRLYPGFQISPQPKVFWCQIWKPRWPWKLAKFANDYFFLERLYHEFLDWISSMTICSILHKRNSRNRIFFTQTWNNLFEQKR
ncbi:hypothetical protein NPIL_300971 [Nephila pilipes]|uniref:Uncharacterized protein n=1 Tax=Nephila pilipes TaxID=299642 RepID=A0A8X6QV99_NEPPI|nr:hypothetical protein NPIL_300971 [Nephila pilipes]